MVDARQETGGFRRSAAGRQRGGGRAKVMSRSGESAPLRVVVVDEELPYPATSGKRIRTWNLLKRLAPRHRITYLSHRNADPREAEAAACHLREHGIEPVVV